jgi:hypothetical protein
MLNVVSYLIHTFGHIYFLLCLFISFIVHTHAYTSFLCIDIFLLSSFLFPLSFSSFLHLLMFLYDFLISITLTQLFIEKKYT